MVLHGSPCGRVGRCRSFFGPPVARLGAFSFPDAYSERGVAAAAARVCGRERRVAVEWRRRGRVRRTPVARAWRRGRGVLSRCAERAARLPRGAIRVHALRARGWRRSKTDRSSGLSRSTRSQLRVAAHLRAWPQTLAARAVRVSLRRLRRDGRAGAAARADPFARAAARERLEDRRVRGGGEDLIAAEERIGGGVVEGAGWPRRWYSRWKSASAARVRGSGDRRWGRGSSRRRRGCAAAGASATGRGRARRRPGWSRRCAPAGGRGRDGAWPNASRRRWRGARDARARVTGATGDSASAATRITTSGFMSTRSLHREGHAKSTANSERIAYSANAMSFVEELTWRGLVHQSTDPELAAQDARRAVHALHRLRPDGGLACTSAASCRC